MNNSIFCPIICCILVRFGKLRNIGNIVSEETIAGRMDVLCMSSVCYVVCHASEIVELVIRTKDLNSFSIL